jgi:hypothetical protein
MEQNDMANVQLNYEQIINRQLDRIASTSAKEYPTEGVKNTILEWELSVLEAFIPDDILGSEFEKLVKDSDEKSKPKKGENRTRTLVLKLNDYINRLAEKGFLIGKKNSGMADKYNAYEVFDE